MRAATKRLVSNPAVCSPGTGDAAARRAGCRRRPIASTQWNVSKTSSTTEQMGDVICRCWTDKKRLSFMGTGRTADGQPFSNTHFYDSCDPPTVHSSNLRRYIDLLDPLSRHAALTTTGKNTVHGNYLVTRLLPRQQFCLDGYTERYI